MMGNEAPRQTIGNVIGIIVWFSVVDCHVAAAAETFPSAAIGAAASTAILFVSIIVAHHLHRIASLQIVQILVLYLVCL